MVLFLTGEVIYLWSSGDLKRQQNLAMAAFNKTKTNETSGLADQLGRTELHRVRLGFPDQVLKQVSTY